MRGHYLGSTWWDFLLASTLSFVSISSHLTPSYKMEPLSITTSLPGLLATTTKSRRLLLWFLTLSNPPPSLTLLPSRLFSMSAALSQLKDFVDGISLYPTQWREFVRVDYLVVVLTACVLTCDELERYVNSVRIYDRIEKREEVDFSKGIRTDEEVKVLLVKIGNLGAAIEGLVRIFIWYVIYRLL